MAEPRRAADRSRRASWRRRPLFGAAVALFLGLVVTAGLTVLAIAGFNHSDDRLLSLQTRLTKAAVTAGDPQFVEDHLGGAATAAAATTDDAAEFKTFVSDSVSAKGPFVVASLWRVTPSGMHLVTTTGGPPLLSPGSPKLRALLSRATHAKTFVVSELTASHSLRLAYAAAATGPRGLLVAYAEEPLPANHRISEPASSPIGNLDLALYLGRHESSSTLLETDARAPLPLRGRTYTATIPFGDSVLTLVMSPRAPLSGTVEQAVPWGIAGGGAVLSVLIALLIWRLIGRRRVAEERSEEIADLYAEQRSIAETLQRSLLPARLPSVPGMEIDVRYLPGAKGTEVGGDWYDVIPIGEDRFVFIVGDVSGRGVDAASVMALLQYAGRGFAVEGHGPAAIVSELAKLLRVDDRGHFATVLCGLVDVAGHEVTLADAGHLPPVVCSDARARVLEVSPEAPIGVSTRTARPPTTATVEPGSVLIAYTDGLVERRSESIDTSVARLADVVETTSCQFGDLLDTLVRDLTNDVPEDDIAVIAMHWLD